MKRVKQEPQPSRPLFIFSYTFSLIGARPNLQSSEYPKPSFISTPPQYGWPMLSTWEEKAGSVGAF